LTFRQASELTWPQLLHVLGIAALAPDEMQSRDAAQDAMFDQIVALRRCLPIELRRIPTDDLIAMLGAASRRPSVEAVLDGLGRYLNHVARG
jgi:hypothetical protein